VVNSLTLVVLAVFIFLSTTESKAQQDFLNGFYMFNPVGFNPAIAGVNDQIVISGIVREQWTGINGAPNTQYVSAHMPVYSWFDRYDRPGTRDYPTGISTGLLFLNDEIGTTQYSRVSVPLSTRVRLTRSGIRLSLGMRVDGSMFTNNIDGARANEVESSDVLYLNEAKYFLDFSTGIYAYHTQWYVGFSMTNMRGVDMEEYGYKFEPHYIGSAGFAQPINENLVARITTLAIGVPGSTVSITATPAVIINNNIETGFSYRYDDMLGAFFSFKPLDNLKVGYWYEYPLGMKANEIGATHELVLQLTFEKFKKRVISPRYFW